jgi:nucleotide-binding universal stress UspA family protein
MITQQPGNRPARIIRRVLHPTRFSPLDGPAFRVACELAAGSDTELIVAHIANAKMLYGSSQYREEIEGRLEALRSSEAGVFISTVIATGPVASEISGLARDLNCELIVMRESAPGWVSGRLIETLSQRVKRMASCPIVCVSPTVGREEVGGERQLGEGNWLRTAKTMLEDTYEPVL